MTTYYDSTGSELVGIRNPAGDTLDFGIDAVGSVISLSDAAARIVATNRYKPFGATIAGTISAHSRFSWLGGAGYRSQSSSFLTHYVRMRAYSAVTAQWTSRDPIWPQQSPFVYADANPTSIVDPTGLIGVGCANYMIKMQPTECWTRRRSNGRKVHYQFSLCDGDLGCDRPCRKDATSWCNAHVKYTFEVWGYKTLSFSLNKIEVDFDCFGAELFASPLIDKVSDLASALANYIGSLLPIPGGWKDWYTDCKFELEGWLKVGLDAQGCQELPCKDPCSKDQFPFPTVPAWSRCHNSGGTIKTWFD
jgi:RHS repeat-associated protein